MLLRVLLLTLLTTIVGCRTNDTGDPGAVPPPLPAEGAAGRPGLTSEQLRPGDKLEVFVEEDHAFDGIYLVRERGDIILPKIGRIMVAGLTVESAEQRIRVSLEGDQLTTATVYADRVQRARTSPEDPAAGNRVYVHITGQVNRVGRHAIPVTSDGTVGVYEAVMMAGGINRFADERKAHISRRGPAGKRVEIPVDLRKIRKGSAVDVPIGNGDIVHVPQARFLPL